ncbi:MAG: hypothetical protein KME09_13230 [Pleurocapsa minor HA4230-MV1]|jgi:hypothetical protein|nr:hypothetical protein [Pleurocapsa minor HA4230-MV1]
MKAIVANVLFGGIFGCLSCANSTLATPVKPRSPQQRQIVSANTEFNQQLKQTVFSSSSVPLQTNYFFPQISPKTDCVLNFCDRAAEARREASAKAYRYAYPLGEPHRQEWTLPNSSEQTSDQLPSLPQQLYIHQSYQNDLVLGFQKTFWPSKNQHRYWGITTIEHWGKHEQQTNPSSLNYTNSAPALALGSASLTVSGGGNHNLAKPVTLDRGFNAVPEFEDFRAGITYHHGITQQLTMGVGFVYENALVGFTQLTYDGDILPIKATISLLAQESGIDFHTHIRFQPSSNFVANYYSDAEKQKFDVNWGVYPGLTLVARGNTKAKYYSAGIKVAIHNDYFSLSATAALDHEQNLQWQLNSQIGGLQFTYNGNQNKSNLELSSQLLDSDNFGIQCSAFVKYQNVSGKKEQQEFIVWGAKIHSQTQVSPNQHQWNFELGYGTSSEGNGLIANGTIALQPDLFLKLGYQEISAISDETKVKLQLSSN